MPPHRRTPSCRAESVGPVIDRLQCGTRLASRHRFPTVLVMGILVATTGAAAATLRIAERVLFAPFPYPEPDRLQLLWVAGNGNSRTGLSAVDLDGAERLTDIFSGVAPFIEGVTVSEEDETGSDMRAALVGPGLLEVLGVPPMIGRTVSSGHGSHGPEAVLSYGLWRSRFGADSSVLGTTWRLSGQLVTIVGVMPSGFFFPDRDYSVWLSIPSHEIRPATDTPAFLGLARLRQGVTIPEARARLAATTSPSLGSNRRAGRIGVFPLLRVVDAEYEPAFLALLAFGVLIQSAASLNVAHLLIGVYRSRRREFAVRMALGADQRGLTHLVVFECVALCAPIAIVSWIVAELAIRVPAGLGLVGAAGHHLDRPDVGLFALSMGLTLVAVLGPALASTWSLEFVSPSASLGEEQQARANRWRGLSRWGLIVAEVAAAMAMLYASGLMAKTFVSLARADWGVDGKHTVVVDARLPRARYGQYERQQEFVEGVLRRFRLIPGVSAAAMGFGVPVLWGQWYPATLAIDQQIVTTDWSAARWVVSDGYFQALGVSVLSGREFRGSDGPSSDPVIVLSETLARRICPTGCLSQRVELLEPRLENASVKKKFRVSDPALLLDLGAWRRLGDAAWTVVGVVRDIRMFGLDVREKPAFYTTYRQEPASLLAPLGTLRPKFVLRHDGRRAEVMATARAALGSVAPEARVTRMVDIEDLISRSVGGAGSRVLLLVVSLTFALLSSLIAGLGAFGVGLSDVVRRGQELSVRAALGASRGELRACVLRRVLLATSVGGLVGAVTSWVAGELLRGYLFGVGPLDAPLMFSALVLVSIATLLGAYVPARRAANSDPRSIPGGGLRA